MLNIPELIDEAKARKIKTYPVHANRASEIGHPCLRYLVFQRTRWQDKQPHDVGLQRVFDLGNIYETAVLNDFRDAGLTIEEQQVSYSDPKYKLTGHIDGKLPMNGRRYPIEIKSMSPFIWDKIHDPADLSQSRHPWVRGYVYQMQSYLFLHEEETGLLFLINKVSGEIKQLEISLDYALCEAILQKCETINNHVEGSSIPDPIPWDEGICGRCGYLNICQPDRDYGEGLEIIDDAELEAMLDRRETLAPSAREYQEVDKAIKAKAKGHQHLVVGAWEVIGKNVARKGYTVPDTEYWQVAIRRRK